MRTNKAGTLALRKTLTTGFLTAVASACYGFGQAAAQEAGQKAPTSTWLSDLRLVRDAFGTLQAHHLILSALVLAVAYLFTFLLKRGVHHLVTERVPYSAGLRKFLPVLNLLIWVAAVWIVVTLLLGSSPLSIIILGLIAALALAAASFHFLQDVVGSVVIVLERPFRIGDRVRIGDREGEVIHIGLRSFQVASSDGSVAVIPNSDVLESAVTNTSHGAREAQVSVDVSLPSGFDLNAAKLVAAEAAMVSPFTFLKRPVEVEIDQSEQIESLVKVRIKAYVFDVKYSNRLRSDLIERTRKGLERAFNQ